MAAVARAFLAPNNSAVYTYPLSLSACSFNTNCYALCAEIYSSHDDADGKDDDANTQRESVDDASTEAMTASLMSRGDIDDLEKSGGDASGKGERVESVGGFTVFQLVQNVGSAVYYFMSLQLPLHDSPTQQGTYALVWIQIALLVLASVTFVATDFRHAADRRHQN